MSTILFRVPSGHYLILMAEDLTQKQEELYADENYREMIDAGVFYGRKKSRTNPKMKPLVLGNRNGIEIINLPKTKEQLDKALLAIKAKMQTGGYILVVATQPAATETAKLLAEEFGLPYVTQRWLGGTLTNAKIILGRLDYYRKLKEGFAKGEMEKYTKKERLGFEKELEKLTETMGGLEKYDGHPAMLLIIDSNLHLTAVKEANKMGVPVVAFANTDSDPDLLDYPIVGNNKAKSSVEWFLGKIKTAVREGIALRPAGKEAAPLV